MRLRTLDRAAHCWLIAEKHFDIYLRIRVYGTTQLVGRVDIDPRGLLVRGGELYRTRRGPEGRARNGKPTGGRAYGYIAARDSVSGERAIHREQAETVRRIFTWYAGGKPPPRWIAAKLNEEGVPSPGSVWNRTSDRLNAKRKRGWVATAAPRPAPKPQRHEARALFAELLGGQVKVRKEGEAVFARLELDASVLLAAAGNSRQSKDFQFGSGGPLLNWKSMKTKDICIR